MMIVWAEETSKLLMTIFSYHEVDIPKAPILSTLQHEVLPNSTDPEKYSAQFYDSNRTHWILVVLHHGRMYVHAKSIHVPELSYELKEKQDRAHRAKNVDEDESDSRDHEQKSVLVFPGQCPFLGLAA